MGVWEMLLLAAVLSIDALNIGVICGFGGIRIPFSSRLLMLLVTTVSTAAAVGVGCLLKGTLSADIGELIGTLMLSGLGLYMTAGAIRGIIRGGKCTDSKVKDKDTGLLRESMGILGEPERCDTDCSKRIEGREAAVIGFALSGDSVACGLSVGVGSGWSVLLIPPLCGLFQMLFLWCGGMAAVRLRTIGHFRHEWIGAAAGILLIVMAVVRYFC